MGGDWHRVIYKLLLIFSQRLTGEVPRQIHSKVAGQSYLQALLITILLIPPQCLLSLNLIAVTIFKLCGPLGSGKSFACVEKWDFLNAVGEEKAFYLRAIILHS